MKKDRVVVNVRQGSYLYPPEVLQATRQVTSPRLAPLQSFQPAPDADRFHEERTEGRQDGYPRTQHP